VTALLAVLVLAISAGVVSAAAPVQTYVVQLTGDNGGDPDGTGVAVIRVEMRTAQVCYTINVRGIGVPTEPGAGLGAAHIHDDATGGIFVDLETDWVGRNNAFTTTGCADATSAQLTALATAPEDYYVNIHTSAFPGGAVRGELG
jgi:hypothetical protein